MVIFHCYVSSPEGIARVFPISIVVVFLTSHDGRLLMSSSSHIFTIPSRWAQTRSNKITITNEKGRLSKDELLGDKTGVGKLVNVP